MTTSEDDEPVMPAVTRGPRGSIPVAGCGAHAARTFCSRTASEDTVEFGDHEVAAHGAADPGADGAVAVEDEGGRGLQHAVARRRARGGA